eukprot:CAMPEP_0202945236 /NCGR_PEP_ID=MMETSP1395-20130829/6209_1 /ASSEMBLY_ACC=CAM_ASM_000871 /TAXON_ID=5961 /ORGANISM="Blepharisma japonicum, Strain Stock R1072" /LENGTH=345 /DNA_ID=CAMNT_0049645001 /DNA_START=124 /DNA_END=1161 /DNA_ORIENTATION=-
MKKLEEGKLPKKRGRWARRDEEGRKKQATSEELEKLKHFYTFIRVLIKEVDPFTTEDIEIALSQVSEKTGGKISKDECKELFHEFILDPQKQKKKFTESKKRFDLVWNLEDTEQNSLAESRFQAYHDHLPKSQDTVEILNFLSTIHSNPPLSSLERRRILNKARELSATPIPTFKTNSRLKQEILPEILNLIPPAEDHLGIQDKLTLLRGIQKHLGDWEKISREFKDRALSLDVIKHTWRRLKATMREEVKEIKKRLPQYHYIKWIRAAIRKLEAQLGKRALKSPQPSPIVDATQRVKKIDILNLMADADNNMYEGFQDNSILALSSSSSFKKFEKITSKCVSPS